MSVSPEQPSTIEVESRTSSRGKVVVGIAATLGMFLAALDTSVNVALPSMTADLDADLQRIQWVIVAFIATQAALVMGAGSFGDRFGLKPVYIFGATTYLAAMFFIAFSPNLETVVGFRVLQAVGTGSLFAVSPAIAASVFPPERRGLSMGFAVGSQALGMFAGTIGAGFLVGWIGWEWIFLGRTPFAVIAIILGIWFLKPSPKSTGTGPAFDVVGAVLLVAGLICLIIGLRLGRSAGWTDPLVLVLLPLAPVLLAAFWRVERTAAWPVLPGYLLRLRGFTISCLSMFLANFGVFVIWFIFPFYIADSLAGGALTLGLMLATLAFLNTVGSGAGGWLCDRFSYLPIGVGGLVIMASGLFLMSLLNTESALWEVGFRIGIVGAGLGLIQSAAYSLMLGTVPSERFGTAGAALSLAQSCGRVLAVAVVGGIFGWRTDHHLAALVIGPEADGLAFIRAFKDVFTIGSSVGLLGAFVFLIGAWGMPRSHINDETSD
ncbi:MAG: MFS transporter [Chloroflexi bacterium]|nr:MFS transporter [Chloroflexota bacterium]